jgi:hypothetical protein
MNDPHDQVEQVLLPGERVLWSGKPDPEVIFAPADGFLIPFYLVWTGMVGVFLYEAVRHPSTIAIAITSVFGIVGLFFLVGRFAVKAVTKSQTVYGLTDSRALVITGSGLLETPIRNVQRTTKRARSGSHMTITFGQPKTFGLFANNNFIPNAGLDFLSFGRPRPVAFYDVADVDGLTSALVETSLAE